ncbi:MAG TPA: hypothetical protein VF100_00765 [Thermoanaerobaculia bacterium]
MARLPRLLLAAALALPLAGCFDVLADWDDCSVEEPRNATLDAAGATRLEIDAGAGSLAVSSAPGAGAVTVRGTACAPDAERLAGVELVTERRGDTLFVEAVFAEDVRGQRRLDLVIEVPASLAVAIDDGSGPIDVRGVASLSIDDGSGEIEVRGVAGDVDIEDGSGAITVGDVGGSLRLDDGSGGIDVADVQGDVRIDDDGSGGIEIRGVGGSVEIGEDGSGGIVARGVGGDFTLHRDGSGTVDVEADGKVTLPRD